MALVGFLGARRSWAVRGMAALTAASALAQVPIAAAQPTSDTDSAGAEGSSAADEPSSTTDDDSDTRATSRGAQAANKATARTAATEGIQLFREQRFAEALDKMQRAQ